METSSLILYIFDVRELSPEALIQELERYPIGDKNLLIIANKMDLVPELKPEEYYHPPLISPDNFITLSAIHEMNIPYLKEKMRSEERRVGKAGRSGCARGLLEDR